MMFSIIVNACFSQYFEEMHTRIIYMYKCIYNYYRDKTVNCGYLIILLIVVCRYLTILEIKITYNRLSAIYIHAYNYMYNVVMLCIL